MHFFPFCPPETSSVPIKILTPATHDAWWSACTSTQQNWLKTLNFHFEKGAVALLPTTEGALDHVVWCRNDSDDKPVEFWDYAALAKRLPAPGSYFFQDPLPPHESSLAALAWALGTYQFDRYKKGKSAITPYPLLVPPKDADMAWVQACFDATCLIRDLINMPACDLTPTHLAQAAQRLAQQHGATINITTDDVLAQEYPAVYTVGKASDNPPCLIDITWSHQHAEKSITLVGKGVCFDSGGLDIKPAGGMLLMKKDMGGAAHVLGLAHMVMALNLPINLRVLIPAVENSINGSAMRPLDIITTRKGTTVEIGNTDAEGRLILCDALFAACQQAPDLIIDCATLTGAARIALGTDLPALFSNNDAVAAQLLQEAQAYQDPVWRLPLHQPYAKTLKGTAADLNNIGKSSYAGAITAALFLEHFITPEVPWVHIDMMAWNLSSTPGRPEGGEAMGLRALYALLKSFSLP